MDKEVLFDGNYVLLEEMYLDSYFPDFLVDKISNLIQTVIKILENGEKNPCVIQKELDKMTIKINDLEEEFFKNRSEIESLARDSIAITLEYVLSWFQIRIDVEDALRFRNW